MKLGKRFYLKSSHGFTLVEMLTTILVVAVLGSMAVPTYKRYAEQARKLECQVSIVNYLLAQEIYYAEHNAYSIRSGSRVNNNGVNRFVVAWNSNRRPDQPDLYIFPELGVEFRPDNLRGYRIRVWDNKQPGSYRQELAFDLRTDEDFDRDGATDQYSYRKYLRPATKGKWRVRNDFWFDISGCPAGETCR